MVSTKRDNQDPEIVSEYRQLVRGLYERYVQKAYAALSSDSPDDEVLQIISKAKLCKEVLDFTEPPNQTSSLLWKMLLGLICVTAVALLALTHVPKVNLSGRVLSSEVQLSISKPLVLNEPAVGSSILLLNCDQITGSAIDRGNRVSTLTIHGTGVKLERLRVDSPGAMNIRLRRGVIALHISGLVTGMISVQGKDSLLTGDRSLVLDASIPELIYFSKDGTTKDGLDIEIQSAKGWDLLSQNVSDVTFWREEIFPSGARTLRSSVQGGSLSLPEVGKRLFLREGDELVVNGLVPRWLHLTQSSNGIELTLDGSATGAESGMPGIRHSIRPSFLEYFYTQYKTSIVWASVLLLYGIAMGIIKLVASHAKSS
jgi:hypothetical protein